MKRRSIGELIVLALVVDPRRVAILEIGRGHRRRRGKDALVHHVVQDVIADRDALRLLAMAAAQPEQRVVHAAGDGVVFGTDGDQPVTARHGLSLHEGSMSV